MAYIYQADTYCDDCGRAVCERLTAKGRAPEDPDDEYTFDSDDYPKYVGDPGESDCPQHCDSGDDCANAVDVGDRYGKVGALLDGGLTVDGVGYVLEALEKHMANAGRSERAGVLDLWADMLDAYGLDSDDVRVLERYRAFRAGWSAHADAADAARAAAENGSL